APHPFPQQDLDVFPDPRDAPPEEVGIDPEPGAIPARTHALLATTVQHRADAMEDEPQIDGALTHRAWLGQEGALLAPPPDPLLGAQLRRAGNRGQGGRHRPSTPPDIGATSTISPYPTTPCAA